MNHANTVVISRTDALVLRGQRAWTKIKATAAEQRELWKDIGEALLVGRKLHKADQKFSAWCKEMGFDMDARVRSDAMWFAQSGFDIVETTMTHPTHIRTEWRGKQEATVPADLTEATVIPKVSLDAPTAVKVAKLDARSKSGDEGSEIAKKHLEAFAKKHNTTTEELTQAAAVGAPEVFFQFTPAQVEMLQEIEANVLATIPEMEESGISREAIAAVFIKVANSIKGETA